MSDPEQPIVTAPTGAQAPSAHGSPSSDDVTEGLRRLFAADEDDDEADYVPGATDSLAPRDQLDDVDGRKLAREIERVARQQSSALAKSRGLLIASQLLSHLGDEEGAFAAARDSAETSPRLSISALSLRKKAKGVGNVESVERSLEATSRSAAEPASRIFAVRLLARQLAADGRKNELGQLLDRAARSGDADDALLLQRIVFRLSQGASLAGVEIPKALTEPVAVVQEIVSDIRSGGDGVETAPARDVALIRAARKLARGDVAACLLALRAAGISEDAQMELSSALLSTSVETSAEALSQLRTLVRKSPTRRRVRELAARAVESGDHESLNRILSEADPGSGTFDLAERSFLAACAGQGLTLSQDDLSALSERDAPLALALGPDSEPAFNPHDASTEALLVQLGGGLTRLTAGVERAARGSAPLSPSGITALETLRERGQNELLVSALELLRSLASDQASGLAAEIARLSDDPERSSGKLLAATIFQRSNDLERASEQYRHVANREGALALGAARGLTELGVEDASDLLRSVIHSTSHPGLRLAYELEVALRQPDPDVALSQVLERHVLDRDNRLPGISDAERSAALLAGALLAARRGDLALAGEMRRALEELDTLPAAMGRLRRIWTNEEGGSESGGRSARRFDISERISGYFSSGTFPRELEFDEVKPDEAKPFTLSSLEKLLGFSASLTAGPTEATVEMGRRCESIDSSIAEVLLDLDKTLGRTGAVSPVWLTRAREAEDERSRRHAYERLAELDEQKGDQSSALLWHKTLSEEFPDHVPTLLRLEETGFSLGEPSSHAAEMLAKSLPPGDRETYQLVGGSMALAHSDLRRAQKYLEPLLDTDEPSLLALRGIITVAQERRDEPLLLRSISAAFKFARTDLDKAAGALGIALAHSRLGQISEAIEWCKRAIAARPGSFAAHLLLNQLESPTDGLEKAEQLEAFARTAKTASHRTDLWFAAGSAWDDAADPLRAADCYEQTLLATPEHRDAFTRLCERREAQGATETLIELLKRRLPIAAKGGEEALELELKLSSLLLVQQRPEEAKSHLEAALSSHPGHTAALRAHAEVSAALGAHDSAEKSLVALRDRLAPGDERVSVERSLGKLYELHLKQLEKAMDAYQAVYEARPSDEEIRADLVRVFCGLGLAERATALQTKIIQSANSPEQKRTGALRLAEIYEMVGGDPQRAGATLERTRKAWPLDADVLEATVRFMDRQGTGGSRGFLLDRAGKDARRKLESERLDPGLLDTLARVARLSGHEATAEATDATRHAVLGTDAKLLEGAGIGALDPRVDDLIAPTNFSAPLRNLLRKTGAAMDAAFSVDLANLGAKRAESGATFERLAKIAQALDSQAPELYVAASLGSKCLPVTTVPARLLMGPELDDLPGQERDYILLRALKLRWLGAGALARSKDEDRWPMLVALLHLFAPNWRPHSVDNRKAAQARALIEQGLARVGYDDDVPMLALEVIGALGNQSTGIGEQPRILANRVGLLGVGDPNLVLSAIASSEGGKLPPGGPSRFRWLESHTEAKDLLLFSTTDKYSRARQALGLAEKAPGGPSAAPHRGSMASVPDQDGRPAPPARSGAPAPPRRPKPPPPRRS